MKFVTPRELEEPQNMALMMKDPVTYEEAMSIFIEEDMCRGVRRVCKTEPAGHKGCKWVFKTKLDENGQTERYKAWLVAQGFSQIPGVDFNETFAPVTHYQTLRVSHWPIITAGIFMR